MCQEVKCKALLTVLYCAIYELAFLNIWPCIQCTGDNAYSVQETVCIMYMEPCRVYCVHEAMCTL